MNLITWANNPWGQVVPIHFAWSLLWVSLFAGLAFLIVHAVWVRFHGEPEASPAALPPGMACPEYVPRHSLVARLFHWVMAGAMLTLLLSIVLAAPMEPNRFGLLFIAGPWFFLGLQELLRSLPPFVAGVATPLLPLGLLFWLPKTSPARSWVLLTIALWFLAYGVLTFLCVQRI